MAAIHFSSCSRLNIYYHKHKQLIHLFSHFIVPGTISVYLHKNVYTCIAKKGAKNYHKLFGWSQVGP